MRTRPLWSGAEAFKKVRESNNAAEIQTAMDAMTQKVYAIFGKIYQSQDAAGAAPQDMPPQQNPDGSVDADGEDMIAHNIEHYSEATKRVHAYPSPW